MQISRNITSPKCWFGKSNYDVTNNAHQIQMTPYATEWTPHENFLRTPLHARVHIAYAQVQSDTTHWRLAERLRNH